MSRNPLGVPEHAIREWLALHRALGTIDATPCAGADRNDWTGGAAAQERAAARCLDCPVLALCDDYALAADERVGVWGGRTERERRAGTARVRGQR